MEIAENYCVIDLDQEWVSSLRKNVEVCTDRGHQRIEPRTIFRVPANMREADPDAYDPKIISIGPYHRGKPHLKAMDDHKFRYLTRILHRNPFVGLEEYLKKIKELEARARSSYSEYIDLESDKFVEMMLLDGCFIVELLLRNSKGKMEGTGDEEEDPILNIKSVLHLIRSDMQKLENQLPFFILQSLFHLANRDDSCSLIKFTLRFFSGQLGINQWVVPWEKEVSKVYHVLHLCHSCIKQPTKKNIPDCPQTIPCATSLEEAGVKFKKKEAAESFLDVTFRKGVMEIPLLPLYDHANTLFRNLIAFEQCFPKAGTDVVAYALLMDCLINTENDVALLYRHGCIENCLGNDSEAAVLFNRLCKGVTIDFSSLYLASLFEEVDNHCKSNWNKSRAKLMHDYFSNPWSALSLAGALMVTLLTVILTLFAVLGYFRPPS